MYTTSISIELQGLLVKAQEEMPISFKVYRDIVKAIGSTTFATDLNSEEPRLPVAFRNKTFLKLSDRVT